MMRLSLVSVMWTFVSPSVAWSGDGAILICTQHYRGGEKLFREEFSRGPVIIPPGFVFMFEGHRFATQTDPRDLEHSPKDNGDYIGMSKAENERRRQLDQADSVVGMFGPKPGGITTSTVTLTPRHLCGTASAKAAIGTGRTWGLPTVLDNPDIYYQLIGRIIGGRYVQADGVAETSSLDHVMDEAELYAFVTDLLPQEEEIPAD